MKYIITKEMKQQIKQGDRFLFEDIVHNKDLTMSERNYLNDYYNLEEDLKKTEEDMQQFYSKSTTTKIRKNLIKKGYIKVNYDVEKIKRETIKISHKGKKCKWCLQESYILHSHHYPIPRKNGGKKIVRICPNCHYTFHKLLGENYYE